MNRDAERGVRIIAVTRDPDRERGHAALEVVVDREGASEATTSSTSRSLKGCRRSSPMLAASPTFRNLTCEIPVPGGASVNRRLTQPGDVRRANLPRRLSPVSTRPIRTT